MKFRKLLGGGLLAAVLALGGVAGLATRSESKSVSAAQQYCYAGDGSSWKDDLTKTFEADGTTYSVEIPVGNFKFKKPGDSWDGELNYNTLQGYTKGSIFTNDDGTNIRCNAAGTYNVTFDGTILYIEPQSYIYTGTGNEWAATGGTAVEVNGNPVKFTFSDKEQFKFKLDTNSWAGQLNVGALNSNYYGIFTGEDNIYVNQGGDYNVSIIVNNHSSVKIKIEAYNPTVYTSYALDLFNNRLQVNKKAHYFHYNSATEATIGTEWHGVDMDTLSGRIYSYTYWNLFDKVIFNNNESGQTGDLTAENGKCYVLQDWDKGQWILLEAAQFIDNYLKFTTIPLENEGTTADCAANYSAAKLAYNSLSSNAVRKEVLKVDVALARLSAWAEANHGTIDPNGGQITPRAITNPIIGAFSSDSSTPIMLVVIISVVSLTAVGGYIFLKRRKEN